jgi:hypothetical protein
MTPCLDRRARNETGTRNESSPFLVEIRSDPQRDFMLPFVPCCFPSELLAHGEVA